MDRFIKEYHGKKLIDWGAQNSSDFLSFARKFKNYLKRSVSPYGIDVAEFYVGHYYISGFVEKEGKFVYFNYDFPRGQKIDTDVRGCHGGVLIRTAKDVKDYRGGQNNFTSIARIGEDINSLLGKEKVRTISFNSIGNDPNLPLRAGKG